MIRVVLAVVLATALLGVSFPAIDDARRDHSETTVGTELQRVERAATDLLAADDPTDDGARRIVTIHLPTRSWTDAGIDSVVIGPSERETGGELSWRVDGGTRRVRHLPNVPIRTAGTGPLTLNGSGRHRLVLSLDSDETGRIVTVRTFTSDEGASGSHARVATDPRRRAGGRV